MQYKTGKNPRTATYEETHDESARGSEENYAKDIDFAQQPVNGCPPLTPIRVHLKQSQGKNKSGEEYMGIVSGQVPARFDGCLLEPEKAIGTIKVRVR